MPITKGLRPGQRRTEATKGARPRLQIVEEILMMTAPKWNGKKFVRKMTIKEACEKEGISDLTFRNWRKENPKINEYYEEVKAARKEMLHDMLKANALENVMEVISGGVKVRPMDKANLSMRYLEKTESEFNPSLKLDVDNNTKLQVSMGSDEMVARIMELSASLNLSNPITNQENDTTEFYEPISSTDTIEESTGDGEDEEATRL